MSENTKIEWCDHTFNPWIGCTKVSPGCAHCYAETLNRRHRWCATWEPDGSAEGAVLAAWGKGAPRKRTSAANWREPVRWNEKARNMWGCSCGQFLENYVTAPGECPICGGRPHRWRPRVFCASLADWLDPEVPVEWLADLLGLIHKTPNLDWLLLTKRPELWRERMHAVSLHVGKLLVADRSQRDFARWLHQWQMGSDPRNVWIGASIENQEMADKRIPELLKIPARVRFLSCEPLLGAVDLQRPMPGPNLDQGGGNSICQPWYIQSGIDWVICGGESGPRARPMNPDWARLLRDQCKAAGVPFFFKQWGEWLPDSQYTQAHASARAKAQWTFDMDNHSFFVGKRAAGRLLDGVEHSGFPDVKGVG